MPGYGWNGLCGFGYLGTGGWIINIVLTVGVLIALVLLVIWALRQMRNSRYSSALSSGQSSGTTLAREILQARYARGEITRQEYKQMLEDIQ
jgi:putative membrane protein